MLWITTNIGEKMTMIESMNDIMQLSATPFKLLLSSDKR